MKTVISISGVESSGKSTLAKALKAHYNNSTCIEEQSRVYLKKIGTNYRRNDLVEIAKMQLNELHLALQSSYNLIITDTSLLDIIVWSKIKYDMVSPELNQLLSLEPPMHYLLCKPDLEYKSDELRESPSIEKRLLIHKTFLEKLEHHPLYLGTVQGLEEKRRKNAVDLIESKLTL